MTKYSYSNLRMALIELEDNLERKQMISVPMQNAALEINKAYLAIKKRKTVTEGDRIAMQMIIDMVEAMKNHIDEIQ